MASTSSDLFALARSKLNLSSGHKDSFSLHRWVLLKNSVIQSIPCITSPKMSTTVSTPTEAEEDDDFDSFMFPDAGTVAEEPCSETNSSSEAAWFDSLLEALDEDEDEDFSMDGETCVSVMPVEDDDELVGVPVSPLSSSDYFYPYLVPYPPYSSSIISPYPFHPPLLFPVSPATSYADPLPYYDVDELDELPVPDAIEDTSDDESDAPLTPGQSLSSLTLDPASIPLPEESRLRQTTPYIYTELDDDDEFDLFSPFDSVPSSSPRFSQC